MKKLEQKLLQVFKELQEVLPKLHKVSFEIQQCAHLDEPNFYGFYHIGEDCVMYETVDELIRLLILFRKFEKEKK